MTTKVRDIPLGVLLIVVAQFFGYGVLYLANFPNILEYLGILLGTYSFGILTDLGIRCIKGIEIAESE